MADLFARVTDQVLVSEFGEECVERAIGYAMDGSVRSVQVVEHTDHSARALASVAGSGNRSYSVLLTITADHDQPDSWWALDVWSRCSCPVSEQCKHGAAVAMALAERSNPRSRADLWEQQMATVLDDLEQPRRTQEPKALALRLDLASTAANRWSRASTGPRLRLVNMGARGQWVKTGITWAGLPTAMTSGSHSAQQLDALRPLYAALLSSVAYYNAVEEPALSAFGHLLWPGLADAQSGGVPLVPGAGVRTVSLSETPVEVTADVVGGHGGARLVLGVEHDGRLWAGGDVVVVGRPVHGVLLRHTEGAEADLILAPLAKPVPASLGDLLTATEPMTLPEQSRARWQEVLLPRLARSVRVSSSDRSVEVRPLPPPRLRLTVAWGSASDASLTWEWVYGDRPDAPRCLIDAQAPLDGLRDLAQEGEVVRRLVAAGAWPGRPVASEKVTGAPALRLALELLPLLRETGLVDVLELERPDFRPAEGDVEVSFEADDDRSAKDGPVDWLDLMVMVRVDGEQVPLPDVLAALTRGEDHLVLPSGLFVPTTRPELAALHDLVRAAAEIREADSAERLRVGRGDLGTWAQVGDLGTVDSRAAEWVRRAHALRDLVDLPTPEPVGVVSTLRDYQRQGFHWLAFLWETGFGGVLADDMGLGKTLQVLALVSHARTADERPFLVVAPTSVVTAWQSEAQRHTPHLRVRPITSSSARRGGTGVAEIAADADVVVTTYTLLRLEAEQYAEVDWGGMVLDEAQQVKNHTGKTYQAVRAVPAPFRLAVTGTPFENRLMELWSLLSITNPGLYPTAQSFSRQVVRPVEKDRDPESLARFRARIRPFMLRRTKELVATDLPPKQEQVLDVQLPPRHRRLYDTHLQRERQKILGLMAEFDKNRIAIFSSLTRLRQLALDPVLVDPDQGHIGSAKLDLLVDHLTEIVAEGHRALVFSQFTSYLGLVRHRLAQEGLPTCYLDGSTRDRAGVIESFRSGTAPVFLISLKAGGVGLTLTEADYVYVLDPWWNPATEAQAVDRTHRIGQDRTVMVYRLVSSDTIEDKVMALKARKAELFAQVVDGDGLLAQAITADDVRALLD